MFKQTVAAAVAALAMTGASFAADAYPVYDVATPVSAFDWSGFYAGVVGTGAMFSASGDDQWCMAACDAPLLSGFGGAIGVTAGFNQQFGGLVAGIEGDISWAAMSHELTYAGEIDNDDWEHNYSWDAYGTLRARLGVTYGDALIYGTAGLAFASVNYEDLYQADEPSGDVAALEEWQVGYAIGGGFEYALTENMSLKAEYLYAGMPTSSAAFYEQDGDPACTPDADECTMAWNSSIQSARVGLNLHF